MTAYDAAIVGSGLTDTGGTPIAGEMVETRTGGFTLDLHVVVRPDAPDATRVRWSSPDEKNDLGDWHDLSDTTGFNRVTLIGEGVKVYNHGHARGPAHVVADVGPPVNRRATFLLEDRVGIGFGCYDFVAGGASIRIVDGAPIRSSLADADVAVVGPGKGRLGPFYGCTGENVDPTATTYRLVFKNGGRIAHGQGEAFVKSLDDFDRIDSDHPLDVRAADGRLYRLHVSTGNDCYFVGWIQPLDRDGQPVDESTIKR